MSHRPTKDKGTETHELQEEMIRPEEKSQAGSQRDEEASDKWKDRRKMDSYRRGHYSGKEMIQRKSNRTDAEEKKR